MATVGVNRIKYSGIDEVVDALTHRRQHNGYTSECHELRRRSETGHLQRLVLARGINFHHHFMFILQHPSIKRQLKTFFIQ